MKLFKKAVDERQKLEILQVERICFRVLFYGLVISTLVQLIFFNAELKQVAGEYVVLILVTLVNTVGHIKKGNWSYELEKSVKVYFIIGLLISIIAALCVLLLLHLRGYSSQEEILKLTLITMTVTFTLVFSVYLILGYIIKKRKIKLYMKYKDDE